MKALITILLFFLGILSLSIGFAQANLDNLEKTIITSYSGSAGDTLKIQALTDLAWKLMYSYPDSATLVCEEALELAGDDRDNSGVLKYPGLTAKVLNALGVINWIQTDYPLALQYFHKSLEIREEIGDRLGMASTLNNIGNIYYPQGQYPRAMEYFLKSLKIREELNHSPDSNVIKKNKKGMADAYLNIGNIYYDQIEYEHALEYYFIAVKIQEKIGNSPDKARALEGKQALALTLNNIGGVYMDQSNFPLGLEYFIKALKIREALGNQKGVSASYGNIGSLYIKVYADYLNAGQNEIKLPEASKWWVVTNPMQLLDTAMAYQQKALEISTELSDEYGMTFRLSALAEIYYKKGDYANAIGYYQKTIMLTDSSITLKLSSKAHAGLAKCYRELGKYQLALAHFKLFSMKKDSMFNEEKSKDLGKMEARYEFETVEAERKRLEIAELRLKNEMKNRRDNLQYSGILIFMVLIFSGVFMLGRVSIPVKLAEGMIFFAFLLFFEFMLVLLDPYIETYSGGAPAYKLLFNAFLAGTIFPLHSFFEKKLKKRISK